jgi:hypothetical protein
MNILAGITTYGVLSNQGKSAARLRSMWPQVGPSYAHSFVNVANENPNMLQRSNATVAR